MAALPVPVMLWYVLTTPRWMKNASCRGLSAITSCIVVQFGLAMMRSSGPIVSPLTSGTTSGQFGSMRQALLLSMTVIPALANSGAHFLDTSPPALNSATCGRAANTSSTVCTVHFRP